MTHYTFALSCFSDVDAAAVTRCLGDREHALADRWALADETVADAVLVDIDSVWGHMAWIKAANAGKHAVAYSDNGAPREGGPLLVKPLTAAALAGVLQPLESAIGPRQPQPGPDAVTGHAPAPASASAAPAASNVPTPIHAPRTLGELLRSGSVDGPLQAREGDIDLVLDPARDAYHGEASLKALAPLLALPVQALQPLDAAALNAARAAQPMQPLARLRWFAAVCATPGALPPGIGADSELRLLRWPQIEREYPRHFRIATAMMKQPGTIAAIAAASGASESDVADFVRGYHALGHIFVAATTAPIERSLMRRVSPFSR
ncbi:MAG: hypothetical protein KGI40_05270 [Xanthomonadaceae bacterium]|nr:hypothetical protein [Xanthomonadaceae bacterium]